MKRILIWAFSLLTIIALAWGAIELFNNYQVKKLVKEYEIPPVPSKVDTNYDVIVYAGEPEGVAAAVSAARNGAKTLLIEEREELGGLFTYGMLNFIDLPKGSKGDTVTTGIYKEWKQLLHTKVTFGIEEAKAAFYKLVSEEENLTLLPQSKLKDAIVEKNELKAITIENKYREQTVYAKSFIDASQDADLASLAGAPYFLGAGDLDNPDRKMAVTLMIHLNGVDWLGVFKAVREKTFGPARMNLHAAWGFEKLHEAYQPVNSNTRLRGLNLVKEGDDYYINALQIFGIDGLSEQSKKEAIEIGKAETEHIVKFLQQNFPGFENAKIASYPTELYVRETRHILAEYQLSMADVWTNRNFDDYIAYGSYPVDVQAQTPNDYGYVLSAPAHYGIPFRSIIPQQIDGLLVVGRSAGYSSLAAGSARIVPTGMGVAEAAGVAAVMAIDENATFRELSKNSSFAEKMRNQLKKQGAYVNPLKSKYPYQGEWIDEHVQTVINKGLVSAGYNNDLGLETEISNFEFLQTLYSAIVRTNKNSSIIDSKKLNEYYAKLYSLEKKEIFLEDVTTLLSSIFQLENSVEGLQQAGLYSDELLQHIDSKKNPLKRKHMIAIVAEVIKKIK